MGISEIKLPAVFFDRDGVLNDAIIRDGIPYPPPTLETLKIKEEAKVLLRDLKEEGFLLFVFTNQPDVARGHSTRQNVEKMNRRLTATLPLDGVFVCYHDDADSCSCRKPLPGMIFEAAERYPIDLSRSFVVGDRWRDIEAGARAGCVTIWIDMGYKEGLKSRVPTVAVSSLGEAVAYISCNRGGL